MCECVCLSVGVTQDKEGNVINLNFDGADVEKLYLDESVTGFEFDADEKAAGAVIMEIHRILLYTPSNHKYAMFLLTKYTTLDADSNVIFSDHGYDLVIAPATLCLPCGMHG